jgi:hypothetical protein
MGVNSQFKEMGMALNANGTQLSSTQWYDTAGQGGRDQPYMSVQRYSSGGSSSGRGGNSAARQASATAAMLGFPYGGVGPGGAALPVATGSSIAAMEQQQQQQQFGAQFGAYGSSRGGGAYASHRIDGRGISFSGTDASDISLSGIASRRQSVGELRSAYLRQHGSAMQNDLGSAMPPHPMQQGGSGGSKPAGRQLSVGSNGRRSNTRSLPSTTSVFRQGSHVVYPLRATSKKR